MTTKTSIVLSYWSSKDEEDVPDNLRVPGQEKNPREKETQPSQNSRGKGEWK